MSSSASTRAWAAPAFGKQHGELVAGEARDDVGRAHAAPHHVRDPAQDQVAGAVPAAVVDRLQPVDIHDEQGALAAVAVLERERLDSSSSRNRRRFISPVSESWSAM